MMGHYDGASGERVDKTKRAHCCLKERKGEGRIGERE